MREVADAIAVLEVTASNIRSLGPAGCLEPFTAYRVWLAEVEKAIAALKECK